MKLSAVIIMMFVCVLSAKADLISDAEAFWTFDSDFTDSSGSGSTHNGTAHNGALITKLDSAFISGSGALFLDGTDDYVDIGSISLSGPLTISAWICPNYLSFENGHSCLILGDGSINQNWIRIEDDKAYVRFNNVSKTPSTDPDFSKNEWQHFVLTRDADGNLKVYRNKENVASDTGLSGTFTPDFIGNKTDNYYKGMIDDLGIWNRVLTSAEIEELFNRGNATTANIVDDTIIATIDVLGDGSSSSAIIEKSSNRSVSLGDVSRGDYEIKINGVLVNPSNGVMIATVRTNSVYDDAGIRYATVAAARISETHSDAVTLTTHKMGSVICSELSVDTAMAWFPFSDWIGAQVDADGTIYAATEGIDTSMVTVVYPDVAPAYDIYLPGVSPLHGMLFVVPSPTNAADCYQANIASTMAFGDGWRVSVMSNKVESTTSTILAPFSFLYLSYDTVGLVGGHINADGTQYSDVASVGGFTCTNTAVGRYTITLDDYTPSDGVMLLSIINKNAAGTYPQDNYLTYEVSSDGQSFNILNQELNGVASTLGIQNTAFVFAFIPFPPPRGTVIVVK